MGADVEWMPIPGWAGYEASNKGQIQSMKSSRRWRPGRILTAFPNREGRLRVSVMDGNGRPVKQLVSRLVCLAFYGDPPSDDMQAAHNDGNPLNNDLMNLRWATRRENYQDQVLHGTSKKGEGHHLTKLTDDTVIMVRNMAKTMRQFRISQMTGIPSGKVSKIVNRKMWSHI